MSSLAQAWVVERHVRGGIRCAPVSEVVERNGLAFARGEMSGWEMLGLMPSYESAREAVAEVKRKARMKDEGGRMNGGGEKDEFSQRRGGAEVV